MGFVSHIELVRQVISYRAIYLWSLENTVKKKV